MESASHPGIALGNDNRSTYAEDPGKSGEEKKTLPDYDDTKPSDAEESDYNSTSPTVPGEDDDFTRHPDPGEEAVERVSKGSEDPDDLADATAWFLSDDPAPPARRAIGLNVGKWNVEREEYDDFVVRWVVQSISRERIREIRKLSTPIRARAAGGDPDAMKVSLMIAAEGTLSPDIRKIATRLGTQDISEVLRRRFRHKPGLIDQIAAAVQSVSGYDDEDVRDASVARD